MHLCVGPYSESARSSHATFSHGFSHWMYEMLREVGVFWLVEVSCDIKSQYTVPVD